MEAAQYVAEREQGLGVGRAERQGLLVARPRLGEAVQTLQGGRAVDEEIETSPAGREGRVVGHDPLDRPAERVQRAAAVEMRVGVPRSDGRRGIEARQSLLHATEFGQQAAPHGPGGRTARSGRKHAVEAGDRRLRMARVAKRAGAVQMNVLPPGIQCERPVEHGYSLRETAEPAEFDGEVVQRFDRPGCIRDRPAEQLQALFGVAGLDERKSQEVQGVGVAWIATQRLLVEPAGRVEPSGAVVRHSRLQQRGVAGLRRRPCLSGRSQPAASL